MIEQVPHLETDVGASGYIQVLRPIWLPIVAELGWITRKLQVLRTPPPS